jgi:Zn-dependent protease with chaperone function
MIYSRLWFVVITGILGSGLLGPVLATAAEDIPAADRVAELLRQEPITLASWPAWRQRLRSWISDPSHRTDAAYNAARAFVKDQAKENGELLPPLAEDALAWYFLGSAYILDRAPGADLHRQAARGEAALRRSLQLDPAFARTHRSLALALLLQDPSGGGPAPVPRGQAGLPGSKRAEARKELAEAQRLDSSLKVKWVEAQAAFLQKNYAEADRLAQEARREDPDNPDIARLAAASLLANQSRSSPRAPAIKTMIDRFPDDGVLICMYALALAGDDDPRTAVRELDRARRLGVDPVQVFGPELVQRIEEQGQPSLVERFAWILLAFAGFYVVVMLLMAGGGVLLASRTRGIRALQLLGAHPDEMITEGQVVRTSQEGSLARLYALALVAGLILFYAAVPFLVVGLLGLTAGLLYLIFLLRRIPIKLVVIVVIAGGGAAWAVLKSVFARPGRGSFGLPKTSADCPRLHQVLTDVARRIDTEPVDEVFVAPGSSIGVHQEGRGPFGIFGVKRRVLTLGLSTMRFLTVSELQAILAHEYAHFSHRDTFYNRFIYQVELSINQALSGMGQSGGYLNYINPFFWFLYLYYKAYGLLSAGFSRSREFLADRMAASLYGSDIFASALTKVATDGALFEIVIYDHIGQLLAENKAFLNMYSAFHDFRNESLSASEREELYQKLLGAEGSLFASHPTFRERLEAVASLPKAPTTDATPAVQLFDNPEEIEKELTEFLTGYMFHLRQLQAQGAATK